MRTYVLTRKNILEAESILDSEESIKAARLAHLLALEQRAEECIRIAISIAADLSDSPRFAAGRIAELLTGEMVRIDPNLQIEIKRLEGRT